MKKIFTTISCLLITLFYLQAQPVMYGLTQGANDGGTISKFTAGANTLFAPYTFEGLGQFAQGSLLQASDGKFYGMTYIGGVGGYGVIFSFNPTGAVYTKLKDFDNTNGSYPQGSLIQASNGKLYGMTSQGGTNNTGVIFSYDPVAAVYTKLKDFDNINGGTPYGSLIQASDGKLYGMTNSGGANGYGVIFSFNPSGVIYTKLKDFDITNGRNPQGSLIQASDGKLYGMTYSGGANNYGAIFSFNPSGAVYTKLKDFDNTNGRYPLGSLIQALDGKLYGMTNSGGVNDYGVIFSFNPTGAVYSKLKDFDITNGRFPYGSLIQASDGKLYGMTNQGGINNSGVIFSFATTGAVYTKLKDFDNTNGSNPLRISLIQASDGKLYGMTNQGGSNNWGVIFSFTTSTSVYSKLFDFYVGKGFNPVGSLVKSADGKLYGMTSEGGDNSYGTIFSFDPATAVHTKLKDFDNTNGSNPYGSLIQASDGKLYGMTQRGGTNGGGVIFSFNPIGSVYTKLKDFDITNGGGPSGSLLQASDGKLYGMTYSGGVNDHGVIFSYNPVGSIYTKLKDFDITNGGNPLGSLIQASDGNLYGMTSSGGSNGDGVIFSYNPVGSIYTKLKDFDYTTGRYPYGSLLQASDGKLYGMTYTGGLNIYGAIFSFNPVGSIYTKLKDFDNTNGANPWGNLIQASNGKLYGMTQNGGVNGKGVVFSFDPTGAVYTKLSDFDDANGSYPNYNSAFVEVNTCSLTVPTTGVITQPTCAIPTGSVVLTGLSATGTWTINPGAITGTGTSTSISGLAAGTYNFTVTIAGCTSAPSANVVINAVPGLPTITASILTQPTCAIPTGTIAVSTTVSGGALEYSIDNGTNWQPSSTFTNLAAGSYIIKVRFQGSSCATAYSGNPVVLNAVICNGKTIPGRIEAEDWDTKSGYQYSLPTTDAGGGLKMVGISNGSWMDYNVNILYTGNYTVGFRVATTQAHPQFQIKLGNTVLSTVNITSTGGWDNWQTITVTNVPLTAGTQTLRILSTDNDNCDFNWMQYSLTSNQPPTANAGINQTIQLPTSQVTLTGTGTAGNSGTLTYAWTQISGTAATITNASSASTTVTGLATAGIRVFRLTVTQTDNQTATSDVTITVNPVSNGKTIPGKIEAEDWDTKSGYQYSLPTTDVGGGFKMVGISNGNWMDYNVNVLFTGTYTVGFRVATTNVNAQFQIKLGNTILSTVNIPSTGGWDNWQTITVTNVALTAGNQTIRIQSTNNENCDFNWMQYSLEGNQPPTANAGTNQTITLPASQVTLNGTGTAGNGGTLTYAWTQISGTAATITNASSASTTVTGLTTAGVRVFRLTVTQSDNQTATGDVTITVNPVVVNQPPTANAGTNQTITLPTSQVTLNGTGTAGSGGTLTYAWTQISGTTATITNASSSSTTITGLTIAGVRVFRLTVTQSDNQTATSDVTITVNPVIVSNGKTIPGRIEAEAWDTKSGYQYSVPTTDVGGGLKMVGISNGSWMDYNVTVLQSGNYTVGFRVATTQAQAQFQIKLGNTLLATVNIPSTGSWDNWQTITVSNVSLTAGNQTLRIQSTNNESCDFNWMEYSFVSGATSIPFAASKSTTTSTVAEKQKPVSDETITVSNATTLELFPNPVHDQFIVRVNNDYAGDMKVQIINQSGKVMRETGTAKNKGSNQLLLSAGGLPNGMYVIRIQTGDWSKSVKMIKL